ncbi:MAG: hypothetical protein IJR67_03280 [Acholeplasmatales bacterium]|nr:hypothetical protein [Acholeplasmatales bacterium]
MRSFEEIKHDYINSWTTEGPNKDEIDAYFITDDLLKMWRTDFFIKNKIHLYNIITEFKENKDKKTEMKYQIDDIFYSFYLSTNDYVTDSFSYYDIPYIFKKMYENDLFDSLSYINDACYRNNKQRYFANRVESPKEPSILIHLYDGRKYTGIIPNLYYSKHFDVFEEVLKYYANTIYKKYGLYLQNSMEILIEFCKDYNLEYVEMLRKAKSDAKELDYPNNHEFKYQFLPRIDVKWEN